MSQLFRPLQLRGVTMRNRIWVSPMCQYSSVDGYPTDWHLVHLGSRAVGGAGLVMQEATAVSPQGRISPADAGLWEPGQAQAYARINRFIAEQGAVPAIQLAHAGRKASTAEPWSGSKKLGEDAGGWQTLGPSAVAFADDYPVPKAMQVGDIEKVKDDFRTAATLSIDAGFQAVEVHAAHGYLLHEFLSPLSNQRNDQYGGSLENRMRLPLEVVRIVRAAVPDDCPVMVRISATDWAEGGWDLPQSVALCKLLKEAGIDLIDVSTGGNVPGVRYPTGPGYQVPFAAAIREQAGVPTAAVGMITQPEHAEHILVTGQADAVFLARELLRDPYLPLHAAKRLGAAVDYIPRQYGRAL